MSLEIPRETRTVHLFLPDDRRRMAELLKDIQRVVAESGPKRLGDTEENSPARQAAEEYDAFKTEALDRATAVQITALRNQAWRDMLAAHPPRQDILDDEGEVVEEFTKDTAVGFNAESMARPLVMASIDVDQFVSAEELATFVDDLSDPDFSRIYTEAYRLNTEAGPDPKWSASSWLELTSAVMSRSDEISD